MLYTIVESFGPHSGHSWVDYCEWRKIHFDEFDSIDGILRPNLFESINDDDWPHIVNENYMLHLILDYDHAVKKRLEIGRGDIIGIHLSDHDEHADGFLGYDIIDGHWDISLLTNWRNNDERINASIRPNALLPNLDVAEYVYSYLIDNYSDDDHVEGCRIVSLYRQTVNNTGRVEAFGTADF